MANDGSVLLAKPGAFPLTLEVLEAYRAGGTDTTPTIRRGTSKPLISSTCPKTAPSVRTPPPKCLRLE
eukprot:4818784-Pleurochrysis_carterae.AAC.1